MKIDWLKQFYRFLDAFIMALSGSMIIFTGLFVIPWFGPPINNPFMNILLIILGAYVCIMPFVSRNDGR